MSDWDESEPIKVEHSEEPGPSAAPAAPRPLTWSQEQLVRLEHEWRRLQRAFAYHPHVRVVALKGDPPDQYKVEFRLRTLAWNDAAELEYVMNSSLHIWLPPGFPHEPPVVRPITKLFHPNITEEQVVIDHYWTGPTMTLAQLVSNLGMMLAYQAYDYDPAAVINPTAMDWITTNPDLLPVDAEANLAPDAGGEPLNRICHFGARSLEQMRTQLKNLCDSLVAAEGSPSPRQVQDYCEKMRQSLDLFLDSEMPADLSGPASDLDEWARQMSESLKTWEILRQHRAVAAAGMNVSRMMKEAGRGLTQEIALVNALVNIEPAQDLFETMRMIPPPSKLELHQSGLANAITRAEHALAGARTNAAKLAALAKVPPAAFAGLLQKRLEAETQRGANLAPEAMEKLQAEHQALEVILAHGRIHAAAVKRLTGWREYAELLDRAAQLATSIKEFGAAGIGAYFIENDSGRFGPFELEQKIEMGAVNLAVRCPSAGVIELMNADTCKSIKQSDGGAISVNVPDATTGAKFATTFRLAPSCEELTLQMDYLIREATRMLDSQHSRIRSPESWLGKFNDALGSRTAQAEIRAKHEAKAQEWRALLADLRMIQPFRQRLSTYRAILRTTEAVLHLVGKLKQAHATLEAATARVTTIVQQCGRDAETGQLLVPQKFAKEYPDQLRKRDDAKAYVTAVTRQFRVAAEDIRIRTQTPALLGFAEWPRTTVLAVPDEWAGLAAELGDDVLADHIAQLEAPLGVRLQPEIWPSGAVVESAGSDGGVITMSSEDEVQDAADLAQLVEPSPPEESG